MHNNNTISTSITKICITHSYSISLFCVILFGMETDTGAVALILVVIVIVVLDKQRHDGRSLKVC